MISTSTESGSVLLRWVRCRPSRLSWLAVPHRASPHHPSKGYGDDLTESQADELLFRMLSMRRFDDRQHTNRFGSDLCRDLSVLTSDQIDTK